ncbi:hypothetical protein [Brevibacterium litoralis]|uniref:hypothetical protein n=1 Tax=Brevibacterium litoralis TaxID=3138935 RepID=UPI0032EEC977
MYEFIWRRLLPGPWPVKLVLALVLVALAVYALMEWVFPVIAPHMPFNEATVEVEQGAAAAASSSAAGSASAGADAVSSALHLDVPIRPDQETPGA